MRRRYSFGAVHCTCSFTYKGVFFRIIKRENSDIFRVNYCYNGVRSFVTVYAPFNWSNPFDVEYLYRKTIKAYNEVLDNLVCLRRYNSFYL